MSAGFAAAAAGMAKRLGEAGAMLKSRALAGVATLVSELAFELFAVPVSFCWAQSGRAKSTPSAKVAHHFRIVFLHEYISENLL
jgi:hypothetical protein